VYPEHHFEASNKPHGYWTDKENQKEFFDKLAIKLNIQTPKDWEKVTTSTVEDEGGSFICRHYNGSLTKGNYLCLCIGS
jgi:hypothetical protein